MRALSSLAGTGAVIFQAAPVSRPHLHLLLSFSLLLQRDFSPSQMTLCHSCLRHFKRTNRVSLGGICGLPLSFLSWSLPHLPLCPTTVARPLHRLCSSLAWKCLLLILITWCPALQPEASPACRASLVPSPATALLTRQHYPRTRPGLSSIGLALLYLCGHHHAQHKAQLVVGAE